jgi:predicted enzyme related to lactoylglutathione lyase
MTSNLHAVVLDALDLRRLAEFWSGLLGWELVERDDGEIGIWPHDGTAYGITFEPSERVKDHANRIHFDLTSTSLEDQQAKVDRVLALGGRHIDIGQTPDEKHVVMADPEGNELCIIEPGNNFLADTGTIGAINGDGSQAVGYFWSEALGWPLVWDQDEETAIQSPAGGSKMAWGGPPVAPKHGKARVHLDIAPPAGVSQDDEVERLISLGARRVDIGQGDVSWVVMADPDDNEFCVLTPR